MMKEILCYFGWMPARFESIFTGTLDKTGLCGVVDNLLQLLAKCVVDVIGLCTAFCCKPWIVSRS